MNLERLELLIGKKIDELKNKTVVIIGLGGVGGYATESLTRLGIGNLILIDSDNIEESNINRQLIATKETINMKKTEAFEKRIKTIMPSTNVITHYLFLNKENINILDNYSIDFLVDACDTVSTKKEIILYCKKRKIKFITCMGVGNKLDPSLIKVMKLKNTTYDPIARRLRLWVKEEKINGNIFCVSSTELPRYKGEVIASNSIVPAVAGLYLADYVLKSFIKEE